MKLSVVTTMFRSAPYLREFSQRVSAAAGQVTNEFEIILVNDGSPDESLEIARDLASSDPRVRVLDLSRNFGHHRAIMTGLAAARGEFVFLVDSDLEEPPELLERFWGERQRLEADVVFGVQRRRKGGFVERLTGAAFYALINGLSPVPVPQNAVTARLMTRRYVNSLILHRDKEIFLLGLWTITGYHQVALPVEKGSRGETTYPIRSRVNHALNAITAFSVAPLLWIFYSGLAILLASLSAAAYLVARQVLFGIYLSGWPSLIVSVWLLGGITVFSVGIVGLYLSKVFSEVKDRPYTIIRAEYHGGQEPEMQNVPRSKSTATAQEL